MILKVATLRSLRCLSRFGAGGHGRGMIQVKVESWRKLVKVSAIIKGLRCADRRPSPDSPQPINGPATSPSTIVSVISLGGWHTRTDGSDWCLHLDDVRPGTT